MDSRSFKGNTNKRKTNGQKTENRNRIENREKQSERYSETKGNVNRNSRRTNAPKKKKRIDFVPIFFALMFIYLGVHIVFFATKEKYPLYEVPRAESINENITYQGLIVRDEISITAEQRGYINYYIASGRRVASGATIYTLDKDGKFSSTLISSTMENQNLSKSDLNKIVQRIKNLQEDFDSMDFQKVYDTKSAISAVVMEALTAAAIDKLNNTMGIAGFTRILTDRSGIVSFISDSYDELTEEQLTISHLKGENYSKVVSNAGEEKQIGSFVYKLITDEAFSLYFEMDEDTRREYGLDTTTNNSVSIPIYLNKIDKKINVKMSLVQMSDENYVAKLFIPKYGSNYVNDRYVKFELVRDEVEGIKIPVTSVVEKDYYMIPVDFVPTGEEYSGKTVLKKDENGNIVTVEFQSYKVDREAGWYYVYSDDLSIGSVIQKVDSEDTYTIITSEAITGVYEVNQGYTEFKIVTILQMSDDKKYYLIKPKVSYGIATFDYIIIEADKVTEGISLE